MRTFLLLVLLFTAFFLPVRADIQALEALVLPWVAERKAQIEAEDFIAYYTLLEADFVSAVNTKPEAISESGFVRDVHASLRDYADVEPVEYSALSQPIPAYKFWFFAESDAPFVVRSMFRQQLSWLRSYYANWPASSNEMADPTALGLPLLLSSDKYEPFYSPQLLGESLRFLFEKQEQLRAASQGMGRLNYDRQAPILRAASMRRPAALKGYLESEAVSGTAQADAAQYRAFLLQLFDIEADADSAASFSEGFERYFKRFPPEQLQR